MRHLTSQANFQIRLQGAEQMVLYDENNTNMRRTTITTDGWRKQRKNAITYKIEGQQK